MPQPPQSTRATWTPALWLQLGIGLLTVLVAGLVMWNGTRATTKVDQAARRTEWWKRTQWAVELALDPEERKQEVGILVLDELLDSELAEEDDRNVANAVMSALVPQTEDSAIRVAQNGDDGGNAAVQTGNNSN